MSFRCPPGGGEVFNSLKFINQKIFEEFSRAPQNHRHHIRHSRSRRLCLEIQGNAFVPAVNHVAPWPGRRVRCVLGGEMDDLKISILTHLGFYPD